MPSTRPWTATELAATSQLAVRQAYELAVGIGAAVDLVCVLAEPATGFFGSEAKARAAFEQEHSEADAVLGDIERSLADEIGAPPEVVRHIVTGQPWHEILKVAGTSRDRMIICGTRDKGAVSRFLFGSTGIRLLRNAPCPVWLIKPRVDDDAELDVLAATDLTEVGMDVLDTAIGLARALPVRLTILHSVDDDLDRHIARTGVSAEDMAEYRKQSVQAAEARLHDQLSMTDYRTVERGVQCQIAEGAADASILSAIEELNTDLLIMATVGRGGIPGILLGNTAERLLPELPCSLIAVKPDDFVCPVKL